MLTQTPVSRRHWLIWGAVVGGALGISAVLATRAEGLTVAAAVLLGLVEGLTEWLPISSTGHLTVVQRLLGITGPAADSYAIAIQAGAILAVLFLYPHRFAAIARAVRGQDAEGSRLLMVLAAASLPAAAVGLLFEDAIKHHLFGMWPVVAAWLVGGIAILIVVHRRRQHHAPTEGRPLTALSWRQALVIGLAQTLALWPGTSRSLVTILAATALGLSLPAAVELSFLLGFVILSGATLYETAFSGAEMVQAYGLGTPLIGLFVAFICALLAMRWLVAYLQRRGLALFGWYRIGVALVVAGLMITGIV